MPLARRAMRRRAVVGGAIAVGAVSGARKNRAERQAIEQQTAANAQADNQYDEPVQQGTIDPTEEIIKYKKLLDDGILTQEEFDAKKKEILGL